MKETSASIGIRSRTCSVVKAVRPSGNFWIRYDSVSGHLDLPRIRFNCFYLLSPVRFISAGLEIDRVIFIHLQHEEWSARLKIWKPEAREMQETDWKCSGNHLYLIQILNIDFKYGFELMIWDLFLCASQTIFYAKPELLFLSWNIVETDLAVETIGWVFVSYPNWKVFVGCLEAAWKSDHPDSSWNREG